MNEKRAIGQVLLAAVVVMLFACAAVAVCGIQNTDAASPTVAYVDYASDSSDNPSLKVYISGLDPVLDANKRVDYVLSGPVSDFNQTKIRNIDESGVGYISITGLGGSLVKGTYTISVEDWGVFGFSLYRLDLTDSGTTGFVDETVVISEHYLPSYPLTKEYSWNLEETEDGIWISTLSPSLFSSRALKLYAFERMTVTFTGESDVVEYDGDLHSLTEIDDDLDARYSYSGLSYLAEGTDVGIYDGEFSGDLVIVDKNHEDMDVTGSFDIIEVEGSLTITGKVTVTVTGNIDTLTYDGTEQTVSGFDYDNKDKVTVTLKDGEKAEASRTDVGTTVMGLIADMFDCDGGLYEVTLVVVDGSITIEPKAATVTADDKEKAYGEVDPVLTAIETGLVGEDKLIYTISRAKGEAVGTYTITPAGDELQGNYVVEYVTGTFTITAISVEKPTAVEGLEYNGKEQIGVPSGTGYALTGTFKAVDADDYTATASLDEGYIWSDDTTEDVIIEWSIAQKAATITVDDKNKVYREDDPVFTGSVEGLVSEGDLGEITYERVAGENVGDYEIDASYTENPNYDVTVVEGTLTITQKAATVKADDKVMGKGQDVPELTATVTGLVDGESVSLISYELSTTATSESEIGTYDIIATGDASQGNYNVSFEKGTLTIKPSEKAKWSVEPVKATDLVFNKGEQHLLKTDGASEQGTVVYKVDDGDYTPVSPTAMDAGKYVVSCYIQGDASHLDSDVMEFEVTIAKKSISPEVTIEDWTYGEEAKVPSVTGNPGEGEVTYTYAVKGSEEYSEKVPTEAGEYTVKAVVAETDNYLGGEDTCDFEIYKAPAVWTVEPVGAEGLVYVGVAQKLLKVDGTPLGGTAMYSLDGIEYVDESPSATLAGTYKVYFYVEGDSNHIDSEVEYVNVTITENIAAGKLHDVSGYYEDDELCKDYGVSEVMIVDGVINVTVSGKDLVAHENGIGQMGYWAGIAVLDVPFGYGAGTKVAYTITVGEKVIEGSYTLSDDPTSPDYYDGTVDHPAFVFYPNVATYYECTIALTYDDEVTENYAVTFDMYLTKYLVTFDGNGATSGTMGGQLFLYGVATDLYPNLFFMTGCTFLGWSTDPDGEVEYADEAEFILLDRDGVTLYAIWEENIVAGKLHDESGYYDDDELCDDYDAEITGVEDGVTYVTVSGDELKAHENGIGQTGYWAGFAVLKDPYGTGAGTKVAYEITIGEKVFEGSYTLSDDPTSPDYYDGTINHPAFVFYTNVATADECTVTLTYDGALTEKYAVTFVFGLEDYYVTFDDNVDLDDEYYQAFWYGVVDELTPNEFVNPGYTFIGWSTEPEGEVEYGDGAEFILLDREGVTLYAIWEEEEPTPVDKPTAVIGLVYDGKEQIGVPTGEGYTLSGYMATDAGKYTATATLEEGYIWSDETTDPIAIVWSIAPREATITVDDKSKVYGDVDPELTGTVVGLVSEGDLGEIVYQREIGKDVGDYEIDASYTANPNYDVTVIKGTLTITQKTATVTADDQTKPVGSQDPILTATVEGVIDDFAIVYTVSRAEGETIGTYDITPSGEKSQGNYAVTFVKGTFTITGTEIAKPEALIGLIYSGSEQIGVPSGDGYKLTGTYKAINAGAYTATATLEQGYIWSDGTFAAAEVEWSIAQKAATVTADDKEKTIGTDDPTLTATVEGVIDDYAIVYTLSREAGETVGTYAIIPTGEESQGNYAVTFVNGTFSIVYGERTITDESGKVSAKGEIAEDAQLVVVSKYDPADWENVDLSGKDIIKGLDISISSATEPAYTGTLDITIELGSKYNGTKVTVYHHHDDGSTESFTKTVHSGKVTVTVSDLSPFLVATERASPYVPGGSTIVVPSDANTGLMLAFAALTLSLIGLAVVIYKRK